MAGAQGMGAWLPIETAPKDGTAVWLACDGRVYLGYCEPASLLRKEAAWFLKASFRRRRPEDDYQGSDNIFSTYVFDAQPTHWQPLPEPLTA